MSRKWKTVILLCFVMLVGLGQALRCASEYSDLIYVTAPPPQREPLNNNLTSRTCYFGSCRHGLLGDANLGAQEMYTSDTVHAWSSSEYSTIHLGCMYGRNSINLNHVSLFYYKISSLRSGLPKVRIYRVDEFLEKQLDYTISGNGHIVNGRNEVLLSIQTAHTPGIHFFVKFDFEGTDVEWLILSEVTLCTSPPIHTFLQMWPPSLMPVPRLVLPADSVSPNLTLSCTVTGGGRFSWQWTGPGQISEMTLSDVTRTSRVTFTGVVGRGTVNYSCDASYTPALPPLSGSTNITVEFQSEVLLTGPRTFQVGENVTLECEQFGYFEETVPPITWSFNDNEIHPENNFTYTITTRRGNRLIQNGGALPGPSVISQLSFSADDDSLAGDYVCQGERIKITSLNTTMSFNTPKETPANISIISTPTASNDGNEDNFSGGDDSRGSDGVSKDANIASIAVPMTAMIFTGIIFLALVVMVTVIIQKHRNTAMMVSQLAASSTGSGGGGLKSGTEMRGGERATVQQSRQAIATINHHGSPSDEVYENVAF